ncbi:MULTISPECIES: carbon-nitrogen hydrolase family protein [unclassified Mycolicibacterium]|uniref:carbon-nitrogen hydrolase family protein n=1 Tax=unclassified Mycolicibacterium TaxID=2636767 RepID=UPI0012DE509A|nr:MULTISPECIES: carbon-nitrogen hydrolase family protein [unclassified Mycolicibacterium]MUL80678.1 carbon-nitrogen hydrolase family protein [Mycolicibacterium sp. CBMA 329]MUL86445.1 carbon-nitrogen hydrolase family protein [Mycolicibacterium sp. CBMA 331]MUM01307.1 carbon-nitrogen hydrolase family protein [Mycolicibacterium sp. CBMA 334]MUM29043.1 carbon-nitrogen hydrolase family protein [Mycolicibacterium sp. CBMA 295]MUM36741.1 carbon-nitrogen hydrolase family protein [Mycolicibacterium s
MKAIVKLGVVQPKSYWATEEARNLDEAIGFVAQAGSLGVDLLLFPEHYPGPSTAANRYEVLGPLQEAAKTHAVALAVGTTLETAEGSGRYSIATVIIDREGEIAGVVPRTHPEPPYIYDDIGYEAGDSFPIVDLGWGKVGVAMCSEVFVPEVTRVLALRGAEVCLFPTGILIDELGYTENWRTLIRARAIENLMYTAATVNLFDPSYADRFRQAPLNEAPSASGVTRGIAMIASPERLLAASEAPGILTADLDMERIRSLRATTEELIVPAPYATIPGILSWPREMVYEALSEAHRSYREAAGPLGFGTA